MDKSKRIIVIMLIFAILFSVVSIVINLVASNIDISKYSPQNPYKKGGTNNAGNIELIVEGNSGGTNEK